MSNANKSYDLAIIGAGIVGLSHALAATDAGLRVCVIESDDRPSGASIRNFGMVWPVGMPPGEARAHALRSREIWLHVAPQAGFDARAVGSLHLARHEDERAVLHEFMQRRADGLHAEWLSPDEVARRYPGVRPDGLLGAMRTESELAINPRHAIAAWADWLASRGVTFLWNIHAREAGQGFVQLADATRVEADHVIVCSGQDTRSLFPDVYERASVSRCKLQMLRLSAPAWRIGTHVAGGLTLRHYKAFEDCPTLPDLKQRVAREYPLYDRYGIHVMAAQRADGTLVIGDSHEYDAAITPFDNATIEQIILEYLARMLDVEGLHVVDRWHGIYAKRTDGQWLVRACPTPGVTVVNALGGAGMTLAPAIAEATIAALRASTPLQGLST